MPRTITISSSFASGGATIGPAVADRLGLKFFDRAIPVAVAKQLDVDVDEAVAGDMKAPGRLERMLSAISSVSLPTGLPDVPGDLFSSPDRFKIATERILRQIADGEGGVVHGRAAMVVLRDRPDVLCVRLDGPADVRLAQQVERHGGDRKEIEAEMRSTDAAREAYSRTFYGVSQDDPTLYHLSIDTTVISWDAATDLIVAAAEDVFGR